LRTRTSSESDGKAPISASRRTQPGNRPHARRTRVALTRRA
jgi:hypothetical protein